MLDHRFQILLDEERYRRVTSIARRRGVSAATVIREAIDRGLPDDDRRRFEAGQRILDAPDDPVPDDPAEMKAEIYELLRQKWERIDRSGYDSAPLRKGRRPPVS